MMKTIMKTIFCCLTIALSACTMGPFKQYSSNTTGTAGQGTLGAGTVPGVAIGGSVARSMDGLDRVKLTRALDKAPGTSTSWVNSSNGTAYTVTPIKKVTVNGNSLCREYQVMAVKGASKQLTNGTACVASDGAWSEVNG